MTSPAGLNILIVDDELPIQFALSDYFTTHGWRVECADSLEGARFQIETGRFDVLIADLSLNGSDGTEGLELVCFVKQRRPAMRVVVLTAYGSPKVEREAVLRGADAFLLKPKPLSEVLRAINPDQKGGENK
jgi:ActR/RegA family two-component response regulator